MGQSFLIDTNTVIDYCGGKLPGTAMLQMQQIVNDVFYISPVVKIETLGFNGPAADMQKLEGFLRFGNLLYITDEVIAETIRLRKQHTIKLGDAIVAATALVHSLTILTRNTKDFRNIPGLLIQNPHQM